MAILQQATQALAASDRAAPPVGLRAGLQQSVPRALMVPPDGWAQLSGQAKHTSYQEAIPMTKRSFNGEILQRCTADE